MPLSHNFDFSNVLFKSQHSIRRCTVRTKQMVLNNIQKYQAKISISYLKVKSTYESSGSSGRRLSPPSEGISLQKEKYPLKSGDKLQRVFLPSSRWDACGSRSCPPPPHPSIKLACTHIYTWVEKVTVKVKCFVQNHNAQKQYSQPGLERL